MKLHRLLAFTAASLLACTPAFAGLIGATVTGTLQFSGGGPNYFSPANGFVPAGYLNSSPGSNTVVVSGSANEFGFGETNSLIIANFTDSQLIVSNNYSVTGVASSWVMTFTSTAFTGQSLSLVGQTFTPGLTSSLSGNLITISWAGGSVNQNAPMQATYNIGTAGVPDGGATVLMLAGALLMLAAGQRRLNLAR